MNSNRVGSNYDLTIGQKLMRVHWLSLLVMAVIVSIGLASLYSIAEGSFSPWAERHVLRFLAGVGFILLMAVIPREVWLTLAYPGYLVALSMLVAVMFFGSEAGGAKRWLTIGGVTFQPSEFMKIGLIAALARYYQWCGPRMSQPLMLIAPLCLIAAPVGLMVLQPDLGTAVLLIGLGIGLMFLAGVNIFYFLGCGAMIAATMPFVWSNLHEYQRKRIEVFLNPEGDPLGAGYHIAQSKIALGSGGVTGRGFMQGTQSQLDFLPEKRTDFIFTMFAEEWGFVGSVVLIALFGLLVFMLLAMALRCASPFARLIIAGTSGMIFIYMFINVAMVSGLVPVVGVPLPLVSYGGTSMMTIMIAMGLSMCVYVHRGQGFREGRLGMLY
ncbi:MAG: rod shape-determining protein RodA [Hyphomicrobiaceae bacterium]